MCVCVRLHTEEKYHVDAVLGYDWQIDVEMGIIKYSTIQDACLQPLP